MLVCLAELRNEPLADNRGYRRRKLHLTSKASFKSSAHRVLIHDMSEKGMMIETTAPFAAGESFDIDLPEADSVCVQIKWQDGFRFGCEFDHPLSRATVSAAMLRSPFESLAQQQPEQTFAPETSPAAAYQIPTYARTGRMATGSLMLLLVCAITFASLLASAPFSIN